MTPPPGSDEARKIGCTCPVMDNHHGARIPTELGFPNYWVNEDCPVHGKRRK